MGAVIGEHSVNGVGHSRDQGAQEVGGDAPGGAFIAFGIMQFGKRELAGAVDGDKQIQLALFSPHLCDIDVEVVDGVLPEFLFVGRSISGKRLIP